MIIHGQWEAIAQQARGPYHLTVKSNGCLILISALSPHQLIVTSKHAIGPSAAAAQGIPSHAEMGEDWVKRSITKAGRTEQQLAKQLWDNNWTAVAELCDDSFEEHVLPYSQEKTGLHLHGLNLNTAELGTVPPQRVNEFAKEFGFIETRFLTLDSVDEVKHFTDACSADNGRWNGEHVEGFVVRSPRQNATEESLETFMFKVKFEQPYLRWREWREITRKMLAFVRKQPPNPSLTTASEDPGVIFGVNTKKIQHPDTKAYALWVSDQMKADLGQFDEWQNGRGIVKTRDRFLEWLAQNPHPANRAANSDPTSGKDTRPFDRTLIVPVAVPGCGKLCLEFHQAPIGIDRCVQAKRSWQML